MGKKKEKRAFSWSPETLRSAWKPKKGRKRGPSRGRVDGFQHRQGAEIKELQTPRRRGRKRGKEGEDSAELEK